MVATMRRFSFCNKIFVIIYSIFTYSTVAEGYSNICDKTVDSEFDVQNLTEKCFWQVNLTSNDCSQFQFPSSDASGECSIRFSICDEHNAFGQLVNAYALHNISEVPLGNFSDYEILSDGFSINTSATQNKSLPYVQLDFFCNPYANLEAGCASGNFSVAVDHVKAQISVEFSGACITSTTLNDHNTTTETPTSTVQVPTTVAPQDDGLSPGSILLILVFVAILLYLIGGIVWNYTSGARGIEMLPHFTFWTSLPGYIVDGFIFFFSLITCGPCRESKAEAYDRM